MKKFIMFVAVLFTAIVLTGCFGELESLEWETLPKSVYAVGEITKTEFMTTVSVKINGAKVSLQDAVDDHGATVSGFNVATEGERVITVKYKSLTIYWAYQVGYDTSNEVTPTYDWYDGASSTYTLSSIEDLYGFANIVNGKRPDHTPDSFAGETVKLAADIDLTGKVWEPIGAAPRKDIVELTYDGEVETAPTEGNKIYFLGGKLQNNAASTAEIKWGSISNDPSITSPADFVAKYNAAKTANTLDERDGFFFIDSYVFGKYLGGAAPAELISQFKFYTGIDNKVGNYFEGTFDGQGHEIKGLSDVGYTPTVVYTYANSNIMVKGYTFGLFGVVKNNVTVKNLIFEDVEVVGAYYDDEQQDLVLAEIDSVGAAVGYSFGVGNLTIDNVKVLSGSINGYQAVGGILGRGYSKGDILIQNCENYANISLSGDDAKHTGGIAGYVDRSTLNDGEDLTPHTVIFKNNTNYGNVTGPAKMAGAIVRYIGSGTAATTQFINCRNFGNITGSSVSHGLVGQDANKIDFDDDCVNYGTVVN